MGKKENNLIKCFCGCGKKFNEFDNKGRKRKFKSGHNKSRLGDDSRIKFICKKCGKEFKDYIKRIFCSKKCQYGYNYKGSYWVGKNGYLYYQKGRKLKQLVHRMIIGALKGEVVHHINGNRLDNRIENLKILDGQSSHIKLHNPVLARYK